MKLILLFTLVAMAVPTWGAEPQLTGTPDELAAYLPNVSKLSTLTGYGQQNADAKRAIVQLVVTSESKTLAEALKHNQSLRQELTKTLIDHGLTPDRIRSSSFSSTPEHGWISGKVRSYRVENQVRVSITSEEEFQAVAKVIDEKPELRYAGLELDTTEQQAQKLQALEKACEDLLRIKQLLEDRLGVRLVPRQIDPQQPFFSDGQLGFQGGSPPSSRSRAQGVTPLPGLDAGDVTPGFGRMVARQSITVQFEVELKN